MLRYNLGYYWYTFDKGSVVFVLAISVAIGLLSSIGYFTYSQHNSVEAERQRLADIGCLARNVFHEARGEPSAGQSAVAEVTLNQVCKIPGRVGLDPALTVGLFCLREKHPDSLFRKFPHLLLVIGPGVFIPRELENLIDQIVLPGI